MNINTKVIKEIPRIFTTVFIFLKAHGKYVKVYNTANLETCSTEENKTLVDDLIQQSINIIEKYGDLKISSCPIKMVIIIEKKLNSSA